MGRYTGDDPGPRPVGGAPTYFRKSSREAYRRGDLSRMYWGMVQIGAWLVWFWWRLLAAVLARYELILAPDGSPYLSRWHFPEWIARMLGGTYAFLHHFHASDPDREWHNHPWVWCRSRLLSGAYTQEIPYFRKAGEWRPACRVFTRGDKNFLTSEYHRVLLLRRPVWTLFVAGPKHGRSWGFKDSRGRVWPANPKGEM